MGAFWGGALAVIDQLCLTIDFSCAGAYERLETPKSCRSGDNLVDRRRRAVGSVHYHLNCAMIGPDCCTLLTDSGVSWSTSFSFFSSPLTRSWIVVLLPPLSVIRYPKFVSRIVKIPQLLKPSTRRVRPLEMTPRL